MVLATSRRRVRAILEPVGVSDGDVPLVTTDTSTNTTGSLSSIISSFSFFFGGVGSLSFGFLSLHDDDVVLVFEISSLANRRRVFRTADSFAFMYDNADVFVRDASELPLPP